jgi:predicted ATPase
VTTSPDAEQGGSHHERRPRRPGPAVISDLGTGGPRRPPTTRVHRLKDLSAPEEIFQLGDSSFPALTTLDRVLHNLPVQATTLVGREDATEAIAALTREHRLVSLLGIGGSGKTRLSQAVAGQLVDDFPDGVWFVDLVPVLDRDRIVEAIGGASGLQLAGGGDPLTRLCTTLAPRRTLIVLDNCEHLTDEVADVAEALMRSTPSVHLLTTSRAPLDLVEERRFSMEPLSLGDDRSTAAFMLFEEAAARVGAQIDEADLDDALAVCRHLDGLPLALELAGAQLRHLSPTQLRRRMDDRFGLLQRGRRRRDSRQESLLRVLDDTVEMLIDDERALLAQVAAFPSTFDIDAAESVSHDLLGGPASQALAGLVDRHLVVADSPGRFRLLETVKLYARSLWADDEAPLERHTRWLLDALEEHPP